MLALAGWAVCPCALADEPPTPRSRAQRLELPAGFRKSDETDFAVTLVGLAGTAMLTLGYKPDPSAGWDRALLFDEPVRDALRASTPEGRKASDFASNLTLGSGVALVAFDALGLAWAGDRNPRVARELVWMDAEAYAVTLLVTSATKLLVLRHRPYSAPCRSDSSYVADCEKEVNVSFFSGHSAISATSAGLVCVEHQYLHLYGGAGDALACAGALGAMTATGLLRIASDNHWATDVAVGYLVGFASGYGLPLLLHFQGAQPVRSARTSGVQLRLLPLSDGTRFSMFAVGLF